VKRGQRESRTCKVGLAREGPEMDVERADWRNRVAIDAGIHHGTPCIKGTRIPVSILLGSLADGMTAEQILEAYPQLEREDIASIGR